MRSVRTGFPRWPSTGLVPPIAGNVALVASGSRRLIGLGILEDLSRAPTVLAAREAGAEVYTRYNIPRRCREAEHGDLLLEHPDLERSPLASLQAV
jgi:hypothetical protein